MRRGQKITIYYTATKNQYMNIDSVVLDDIDYENVTAVDEDVKSLVATSDIDRSLYAAIDLYDYRLSINSSENGAIRNYKSTVAFFMQAGNQFYFESLDGSTSVCFEANKRFLPMRRGQKVTIYYIATKNEYMDIDSVLLADIDYENLTAVGDDVKSQVDIGDIDLSLYTEVDLYDYILSIKNVDYGAVRSYKSFVMFFMQSGNQFYFESLDGSTSVCFEANKRFPSLRRGQKIIVYYTATKNKYMDIDSVVIDDIQLE